MTRVAVFGPPELAEAARALGLVPVERDAELVLLDLRDADAVAAAAAVPSDLARVLVADPAQDALLRAIGAGASAPSCDPAVIGPLVALRLPRRARGATRVAAITSVRGGTGRTLLVANLAVRLAARLPVCVIDATGTGAVGWWLRAEPRGWAGLEGLVGELAPEHLRVVASTPRARLRVLGAGPVAPSEALLAAAVRAAVGLGELVLVDAPLLADPRTAAIAADRWLLVSYDDPLSVATLSAASVGADDWLIASQSSVSEISGRPVFRTLPRDERAVGAALGGPHAMGGALGRAYDDLAELLAIDAS